MTELTKKERADLITAGLKELYPDAACSLDHDEAWKLLFSARLAAQCTDARVNIVAAELYDKYPTVESLAEAGAENIERIVRPCGLGNSKARDIAAASKILAEQYGGEIPNTMEGLLSLPGVGRKIANLVLGDVFGIPAVVVDTHCLRLANRFGLVETKVPEKAERELRALLDPAESNNFCHRTVFHGRAVCTARRAMCESCGIRGVCARVGVEPDVTR